MSENDNGSGEKTGNESLEALAPKTAAFVNLLAKVAEAGGEAVAEISEISERLGGEVGLGLAATGTGLQASVAITSNLYSQMTRFGAMWVLEAKAMSEEADRVTKPDIIIPGQPRQQ